MFDLSSNRATKTWRAQKRDTIFDTSFFCEKVDTRVVQVALALGTWKSNKRTISMMDIVVAML
jgi:hypothetical protein